MHQRIEWAWSFALHYAPNWIMHTLWDEHRRNVRLHSATAKLAMMILVWWHCPLLLHHVTVQWLPPFVPVHTMAAQHSYWAMTHTHTHSHVCCNADILTVQCFWDIFTFPFLNTTETVSESAQRHGCQVATGNHFKRPLFLAFEFYQWKTLFKW